MIEALIAQGHPEREVWSYTPRKMVAYLTAAAVRQRDRDLDLLQLHLLAAQGEPKKILAEIKKATQ